MQLKTAECDRQRLGVVDCARLCRKKAEGAMYSHNGSGMFGCDDGRDRDIIILALLLPMSCLFFVELSGRLHDPN